MKRPALAAMSLSNSTLDQTSNNLTITVNDTVGNTQVINLSPLAQEQLLLALLSRPPVGPQGEQVLHRKPLTLQGIRNANSGPPYVLELLVGQNLAIHMVVPMQGLAPFQRVVAELGSPASGSSSVH